MTVNVQDTENFSGISVDTLTGTKTFSYAVGDAIVVFLAGRDNAGGLSTVTTTGSNLTFSDSGLGKTISSRTQSQVFIGYPTGSGSGTITANFTEVIDTPIIGVVQLRSSTGGIAKDAQNVNSGNSTALSVSFTTTQPNTRIIVQHARAQASSTISAYSPYTDVIADTEVGSGGNICSRIIVGKELATAGADTAVATISTALGWVTTVLTFYSTGSSGITPDLLTNVSTFYDPIVELQVEPALFTNVNIFYDPIVELQVEPALFTNVNIFYDPTVELQVTPDVFTNVSILYNPTVGPVFIEPDLLSNVSIFYSPTVGPTGIEPDRLNNTSIFYDPTLVLNLGPDTLVNISVVFDPTTNLLITLDRLDNTSIIFSPEVGVPPILLIEKLDWILEPDITTWVLEPDLTIYEVK